MSPMASVLSVQAVSQKPGTPLASAQTTNQRDAGPPPRPEPKPVEGLTTGSTAAGEITIARSLIPPVLEAPTVNASSPARDGGQGKDTLLDADALLRSASNNDAEAESRDAQTRLAEAEIQRQLEQKEIFNQIPVPVDAIPRLAADVEALRELARRNGIES